MALVEDPVVLVDDGGTYVGSQVTVLPGIRAAVKTPKIYTIIKKRR